MPESFSSSPPPSAPAADHSAPDRDFSRVLEAAIGQAEEMIVITSADGTIEYVNPAFEKVTGWLREEAVGQNPRILKSGKQDESFYRELWETLAAGRSWQGRLVNRCKNGALYVEESAISPVRDGTGAVSHYVAVKRDVTERVRLEQQYRQAQKMDEMGRLASGVAHDFNNMLQAILGFNELLMEDFKDQPVPLRRLREMEKAARRAAELTRSLLAFSREEPDDHAPLDLNEPIRDAKELIGRLIGANIRCTLDLAPDIRPVKITAGQVSQMLMNLAVNARDAMPDGGRLTLGAANIAFSADEAAALPEIKAGNFVCLSVTDTGTGMTPEVREHLFEPFFTTKPVHQGTGLGLPVVYGIVKQHGGWIHVYSAVGHGTTFKIYLPACDAPAGAAPALPEEPAGRQERVLLVEDDMTLRNLCIRILGTLYQVEAAGSLEEARALFNRAGGRFDLLFSDIMLPDGTGIELADELRRAAPALPVVLCSGYSDAPTRWSDLPKKGYHFLQKPFTLTELLSLLRKALSEKTAFSQRT